MTRPRLVLDTSVLRSALRFPAGAVSRVRTAWRAGRIRSLASRDTTAELPRVPGYPKFGLTAGERQDLLDEYRLCCETVAIPDPPPPVPECRNPFDRPFPELALAGRADALATGDADSPALADRLAVPERSPFPYRRPLLRGNGCPRHSHTDARRSAGADARYGEHRCATMTTNRRGRRCEVTTNQHDTGRARQWPFLKT